MSLKTLSSALTLLDYFTPEHPSWGVRALAKASRVHPAVVQRMLATYAEHGFLERVHTPAIQYQIGLRFYELGTQVRERLRLTDLVKPALQELAKESGETSYLTWLRYDEGVCLEIGESPNSIHYRVRIGSHTPLHAGAANKAILAFFDQEALNQWFASQNLAACTDATVTDRDTLCEQLRQIRERGWAYTEAELVDGSFGLAVPLFNHLGQVIGSLALAGPRYRFDPQRIEMLAELLTASAEALSKLLNHFQFGYGDR